MRARLKVAVGLAAALVITAGVVRVAGGSPEPAVAAVADRGDSGDEQVLTSYDDAMVRKRAAIAILPRKGANEAHIKAEMQSLAAASKIGPLTEATFAVFSEPMLEVFVPQVSLVLPEGISVTRAEALMRDHQPDDVAFFHTENVLVHDITFAVVAAEGVEPAAVKATEDREGIITDELNHYVTTVQPAGVTVRYFGAVLSDKTIESVRNAMGGAAHVPGDRVQVSANLPGPGVDISGGAPDLNQLPHGHH